MSRFKTYWGKAVPDQDVFSARYSSLYGNLPMCDAILANQDIGGAVVFDGETWRELDLAAMQKDVSYK